MAKEDKARKKAIAKKATRKEAEKLPTGRPAMFQTPEQMQEAIDAYFDSCKPKFLTINGKTILDKTGMPVIDFNPPTTAGLALSLGFESRQSLYDYAKREGFSYIVIRARTRIEADREKDICAGRNVEGSKFHLANMSGWKAEQEKKHDISVNASISNFSVDKFLEKFNAEK